MGRAVSAVPEARPPAEETARAARASAASVARAPTAQKRAALRALAKELRDSSNDIIAANSADMEAASEAGLSAALLDRLSLDAGRIEGCAKGAEEIAALEDPVGEISGMRRMPSGISVGKMRGPIGVVLVIYESRPGVTVDAGALCLMSGNAVILKGGKEARRSNRAFGECFGRALAAAGLDAGCVREAGGLSREEVGDLLRTDGLVDLVIPRGGKDLVKAVCERSTIPVIKHLDGNCHLYVDEGADLAMALDILMNAKTQRPGVCNAVETLLVHERVAGEFLPAAAERLAGAQVELRGCPLTREIVGSGCAEASESDWDEEYLGLVLAAKVTPGVDDAIAHVNRHGSGHTDAIVTSSHERAWRFLREVDSSSVMVNASTRFADGGCYGLGAEIGISTDRIHARGPVGLRELTIEKYAVLGEGQVRE